VGKALKSSQNHKNLFDKVNGISKLSPVMNIKDTNTTETTTTKGKRGPKAKILKFPATGEFTLRALAKKCNVTLPTLYSRINKKDEVPGTVEYRKNKHGKRGRPKAYFIFGKAQTPQEVQAAA
jgi:hypothetical protein